MKKLLKISALNAAMLIGAVTSILLSGFGSFANECEEIPDEVLRLHIIAQSDSEYDQAFKYDLRDFLLSEFSMKLSGSANALEARDKAAALLPEITEKANEFAAMRGYPHSITAEVAKTYFTTRVYDNVTLPAGDYYALRVIIGDGAGRNWWCVMFPPLCLPACTANSQNGSPYFSTAASARIENGGKVKVKFAIYEALEKLFK